MRVSRKKVILFIKSLPALSAYISALTQHEKAKYFDFEGFEGIIYENQKIAGAGIEMLGIMGKLKPLES